MFLLLCATIGGLLLQTAQAQVGKHKSKSTCKVINSWMHAEQGVYDYTYCKIILFFSLPVEVQSYNYADHYIGHTGSAGYIQRRTQPVQWRLVTPGLCGLPGTVSLQLSANSNVYFRHRGFLFHADPFQETSLFRNDACFYLWKNKWFPGHDAFESVNFRGRFIRHQGFRLKLHPYEGVALFEKDTSFRIVQPICHKMQSRNIPSYNFGVNGNEAFIKENSDDRFILIRSGLTGHAQSVSFRSCSDATKYLRHRDFNLHEDPYSSAVLFRKDATFTIREDKWFDGFDAFESVNFPEHFIRHQNYRLKISSYDGSELYKKDASFSVLPWQPRKANIHNCRNPSCTCSVILSLVASGWAVYICIINVDMYHTSERT